MSGRHSLFARVLDEGDAPLELYNYLEKKWAVPKAPQEFTVSLYLRSNKDSATGAVSDT